MLISSLFLSITTLINRAVLPIANFSIPAVFNIVLTYADESLRQIYEEGNTDQRSRATKGDAARD